MVVPSGTVSSVQNSTLPSSTVRESNSSACSTTEKKP
jgi:hypothetical protein